MNVYTILYIFYIYFNKQHSLYKIELSCLKICFDLSFLTGVLIINFYYVNKNSPQP